MDEPKPKTTPRDFFLNLLSIIALYVSAVAFGTLLFQYVNHLFPDPLDPVYANFSSIRFAIASLVVLFPVYIWSVLYLQGGYEREPSRKDAAVRRWMVNFTLFAAALIIIGDFVAIVMKFLEGELTARFALKVVAILFVAGLVFSYYLWDLRGAKDRKPAKGLAYGVSVMMLVVVVASFIVIGTPGEQRMRLFDERRVSDLQYLQSEIVAFWQSKDRLPGELSELEDDLRGVSVPVNPGDESAYVYNILSDKSFELCATFDTDSEGRVQEALYYPYGAGSWEHGAGRICFERTIDPDFYDDEIKPLPR